MDWVFHISIEYVVLTKKIYDFVHERHVQAQDKAVVVHKIFFLEDDLVSKLIRDEGDILCVTDSVNWSWEESDWNIKVFNWNKRWFCSAVDLLILNLTVVKESVTFVIGHLGIVKEGAISTATWWSWDSKRCAVYVINAIFAENTVDHAADTCSLATTLFGKELVHLFLRSDPVSLTKESNSNKFNILDVFGRELKEWACGVGSASDWCKSNEKIDLFFVVIWL